MQLNGNILISLIILTNMCYDSERYSQKVLAVSGRVFFFKGQISNSLIERILERQYFSVYFHWLSLMHWEHGRRDKTQIMPRSSFSNALCNLPRPTLSNRDLDDPLSPHWSDAI